MSRMDRTATNVAANRVCRQWARAFPSLQGIRYQHRADVPGAFLHLGCALICLARL
jgi:hypothetical protein